MRFRLRPKPKLESKKIEKRLEGLATHEDITKLEKGLKNEKLRARIASLTPRQRVKLFRIIGKRLQEKHVKE